MRSDARRYRERAAYFREKARELETPGAPDSATGEVSEEPETTRVWPVAVVGLTALGAVLGQVGRDAYRRWARGGERDLAARIVQEGRRLCTPTPPLDYVGPGEERWDDQVLGGSIGPDAWQWYQRGTTSAIVVTAILEYAGIGVWTSPTTGALGKLLLNRPEPVGVGYVPGAWVDRLVAGGDACGVRRMDAKLQTGDVYYAVRDRNPARWAIGVVLERDGERVLTADGGHTAPDGSQCARLTWRTLRGRKLGSRHGAGEVTWRLTFP